MVYSSTSALQVMKGFSPTSFVINQVAFWVVGLVAMFFIYKMKTSVFQNRSFIMFAIAVITVMVLDAHFTSREAGEIAKAAQVKQLMLTHLPQHGSLEPPLSHRGEVSSRSCPEQVHENLSGRS